MRRRFAPAQSFLSSVISSVGWSQTGVLEELFAGMRFEEEILGPESVVARLSEQSRETIARVCAFRERGLDAPRVSQTTLQSPRVPEVERNYVEWAPRQPARRRQADGDDRVAPLPP